MKLYQYWDTPEPPDEVAAWIEEFRVMNPEMQHRLYDRDAASWFIGKHIGQRERKAFEACAVPSMQSDYFRVCAVKKSGGAYVDADYRSLQNLSGLLQGAPHGMLQSWDGELVHGFMMIRRSDDPFIDACIKICTLNVESRDVPNAYTATGPGVLNALQAVLKPERAPALLAKFDNMLQHDWLFPVVVERARREITVTSNLVQALDAITLISKRDLRPWLGKTDPPYKHTERHWMNWRGPMYRDAAAGP